MMIKACVLITAHCYYSERSPQHTGHVHERENARGVLSKVITVSLDGITDYYPAGCIWEYWDDAMVGGQIQLR